MVNHGHEGPNLIVVPTSVLPNWERESEKFVPHLKRLIIYGTRREGMFRKVADSDIVVTTYALLRRDLEELDLGDLAGAATLAKELDAQMRALSEMLAHAGAQPREAEHVAQ